MMAHAALLCVYGYALSIAAWLAARQAGYFLALRDTHVGEVMVIDATAHRRRVR